MPLPLMFRYVSKLSEEYAAGRGPPSALSLLTSRDMRVVRADQAEGGRLPLRPGSLDMWTEVREPSADHEAGRVPVIPVLLISRDCSASKLVQAEGRLPTTFRSPSKLRCVSDVSVDQEDGRLPS